MGPLIDASINTQEYEEIINVTLKRMPHSHLNNVIFSYLNINSIRKDGNIVILCISETKLDEYFSQ